jgi:hypothetical protein
MAVHPDAVSITARPMAIDPDIAAPMLQVVRTPDIIGTIFNRHHKAASGRWRGGRANDTASRAKEDA